MINKEKIIEVLKNCYDPELRIDVYTLGLIYKLEIIGSKVNIQMTLTSPMCPYGPMILDDVKTKVGTVENVKDINIDLVFEPVWQPTEEVKLMLGLD